MNNNNLNQEEIDIDKITSGHFNSDYFKDLPIERKIERVCLAAIRHNSVNIEYMADECELDLLIYTMLQRPGYKIDEKKGIEDNLIKLIEEGNPFNRSGTTLAYGKVVPLRFDFSRIVSDGIESIKRR